MSAFRMFKARGQPGCWYGYVEVEGHTYKINARHVGERQNKHFEGTVERHLKADQQKLPLTPGRAPTTCPVTLRVDPNYSPPPADFDDDDIPENPF